MFREILQSAKYSLDGKAVLRALMNKDFSLLDLLVRESIQNSLDAGIDSAKTVHVDFISGKFDSHLFCNQVSTTDEILKPQNISEIAHPDFLAIRDSFTEGLLGDDSDCEGKERDKMGNLGKLVYNLGMNREGEGKGGSYGYGKTTYFKLGIGLVIFYSRTYESGEYVSKLVISLIEDATSANSLFQKSGINNRTGIAWWGSEHIDPNGHKCAAPIKDCKSISEILSVFHGVEEYTGNQTGTTIIIPYLMTEYLLMEARRKYGDDGPIPELYYTKTLDNFLTHSIQKWYFPRINSKSTGARLVATVNGEELKLTPLFKICKDLYNKAKASISEPKDIDEDGVKTFEVKLTKRGHDASFSGLAGILACKLVENKTSDANWIDLYEVLFGKNDFKDGQYKPILMFTRKPGMIVNYQIGGDGMGWLNGVPNRSDACPISIFVANSNPECKLSEVVIIDKQKVVSLEDYLRSSEKAIHNDWQDSDQFRIANRIKNNVSFILCEYLKEISDTQSGTTNKRLSRAIAQWFLPQGLGTDLTSIPKKTNRPVQQKLTGSRLFIWKVYKQHYFNDSTAIPFFLQMRGGVKVKITISISTETGFFDEANWIDYFSGKPFPCEIKEVKLNESIKGKNTAPPLTWNPRINAIQLAHLPQGIKRIMKESESAFIIETLSDCAIDGYVHYSTEGNWAVTIKAE